MMYQTHVATSLAGGVAIAQLTNTPMDAFLLAGIVIGSLAPDLDHPGSKLGRRSLGIAHVIHFLFGHRTITHSILPVVALILLSIMFPHALLIGFTLGYILHIAGDVCSVQGVPLLYPFNKKHIKIPLYNTNGLVEKIIIFPLACLSIMYLIFSGFVV